MTTKLENKEDREAWLKILRTVASSYLPQFVGRIDGTIDNLSDVIAATTDSLFERYKARAVDEPVRRGRGWDISKLLTRDEAERHAAFLEKKKRVHALAAEVSPESPPGKCLADQVGGAAAEYCKGPYGPEDEVCLDCLMVTFVSQNRQEPR